MPTSSSFSSLFKPRNTDIIRQRLTAEDTFATVLAAIFIDEFGADADCLSWTSETVYQELLDAFQVELPRANLDRLMAALTILSTDLFYTSAKHFVALCNILSGDTLDPTVFDPASVEECAWGITEAFLLSPPEQTDEGGNPFSRDIQEYVRITVENTGLQNPPDILQIAGNLQPQRMDVETFAGDQEMFLAFYQSQQEIEASLKEWLKERQQQLQEQLSSLPLQK